MSRSTSPSVSSAVPHPAEHGKEGQPRRCSHRAEVGWVLPRRARPPCRQHLLARVDEQRRRQADRPDLRELVDLEQHRLQPEGPRIRLQLGQESAVALTARLVHERLESGDHRFRQASDCLGAEPALSRGGSRRQKPIHLSGCWRLQVLCSAARQQCFSAAPLAEFHQTDVVSQPGGQSSLVLGGTFAEAERLANLGAVVLGRASRPLIVRQRLGTNMDLLRQVANGLPGQLADVAREATVKLKELEEECEGEARRAALVSQKTPVVLDKRPARHEIFEIPLAPQCVRLQNRRDSPRDKDVDSTSSLKVA